jgi:hypothetical protein
MIINCDSNSLSIVDWFQIVSAVGTVIAAFAAMITTFQNRKANIQLQKERHMMVKPLFRIRSHFEQRDKKRIEFNIVNLGFKRVMNSIDCDWDGTNGIKVKVIEFIENKNGDDLKIVFDFSGCEEKNIRGSLSLVYSDIFGKQYKETVNIEINSTYNDIHEEYIPILKNLVGEYFI